VSGSGCSHIFRLAAALLGGLGFVAVSLVPFLKYPANPPATGDPETIAYRTLVYLVLMLVSIIGMILAVMLRQGLVERFGGWNATLIAGGAYLVAIIACYAILPGFNENPQQALPSEVAPGHRAARRHPADRALGLPAGLAGAPGGDVVDDRAGLRRVGPTSTGTNRAYRKQCTCGRGLGSRSNLLGLSRPRDQWPERS
jgi:hypothetical protein